MKWQLQLLIFSRSSDSNSNTVSHCYNSSSVPIIVWNPGSSMCLGELTVFFILSLFVCCICSCCSLCIISTFKIMTWIVSSISAFTVCLGSNGNIRYIVATHSQSLLVYENMTLRGLHRWIQHRFRSKLAHLSEYSSVQYPNMLFIYICRFCKAKKKWCDCVICHLLIAVTSCVCQRFERSDCRSEWRRPIILFVPRHGPVNEQSPVGLSAGAWLCQRGGRNETAPACYQRTAGKIL